jgi:hypothetical protein
MEDLAEVRFAGNTRECFNHLMDHSEDPLQTLDYVADFCQTGKIGSTAVFNWWRDVDFPGGIQLARLRLLLHLGGYNVTEVADLSGLVRRVLFIAASSISSPEDLSYDLGYAAGNSYGLWSVLLQGKGYAPRVGTGMEDVLRRKKRYLYPFFQEKQPEIVALIKTPKAELPPPPPMVELPALSLPSMATVLDSLCRGGSELAKSLIETGDIQGIMLATNGGVNLKELRTLLGMIVE